MRRIESTSEKSMLGSAPWLNRFVRRHQVNVGALALTQQAALRYGPGCAGARPSPRRCRGSLWGARTNTYSRRLRFRLIHSIGPRTRSGSRAQPWKAGSGQSRPAPIVRRTCTPEQIELRVDGRSGEYWPKIVSIAQALQPAHNLARTGLSELDRLPCLRNTTRGTRGRRARGTVARVGS